MREVARTRGAARMRDGGDVYPAAAYAALPADTDALLVDGRTMSEWSYVGLPDLSRIGKHVIPLEWQRFPDGAVNRGFVEQLREAGVGEGPPIYFLCRSGVRSAAPAEVVPAAGLGPADAGAAGFGLLLTAPGMGLAVGVVGLSTFKKRVPHSRGLPWARV